MCLRRRYDFKASTVSAVHAYVLFSGDQAVAPLLWSDNDASIQSDAGGGAYNCLQFLAGLRYFNKSGNGLLHFPATGEEGDTSHSVFHEFAEDEFRHKSAPPPLYDPYPPSQATCAAARGAATPSLTGPRARGTATTAAAQTATTPPAAPWVPWRTLPWPTWRPGRASHRPPPIGPWRHRC